MKSKTLAIVTVVTMLLTLVTPAMASPPGPEENAPSDKPQGVRWGKWELVPEIGGSDASELAIYIVQLYDPPLAAYRGGIAGLRPTNAAARGEKKLDSKSRDSLAYLDYLVGKRAEVITEVNKALDRSIDVIYEYRAALNGFAAEMTPAEANVVAHLPSVKSVEREVEFELHTDAGPAWMGAPGIWDGTQTGGLPGTMGEGIIVGVIDTGIDPWNPSFLDVGGDGYDHTNPWGAGTYVGVCDSADPPYDPTFPCNDKLIGAWSYASVNAGDPRDADGHGSHTASTAAGNIAYDAVITTPTDVYTADISGVAPHANIVAYAACCTSAALSAAKDQVILDGVDVVNYSIGASGGTDDIWSNTNTQAWLNVRDAGIFVATSAGNDGPEPGTMGSPGDAPWMLTVGANSHNRAFLNSIVLDDGTNPPVTVDGLSMTGPYGTAPVVYATDYVAGTATADDARLCAPGAFPAGTFSGEIVVCERGIYGRVDKGQSVKDGGAGGYVLAQPEEFGGGPGSVASDPHVLPGVHIDYAGYQTLKSVVTGTQVVSGTITGAVMDIDDAHADVMAEFSSRGPVRSDLFIKPDVTAPGRSIWAAYHQGAGGDGDYTYNVIGGTSMSSPHAAGAAALLRALHPDWTPAQVQSALTATGRDTTVDEDGTSMATPFVQGAGHIDLGPAAQAGFVLDVTTKEFEDANPAEGGDPTALNLASLTNGQCIGQCTWTRVLSSTQATTVTWTASTEAYTTGLSLSVTPPTFELTPYATQMVTVEADVSGLAKDAWGFGKVTFAATGVPTAHFPVAVMGAPSVLPDLLEIQTHRNAASKLVKNLKAIEIVTTTIDTYGLAKGTAHDFQLYQDPTRDIPEGFFDNPNQVFWMTMTVEATDKRLVAEIIDTTSPDLDMAVGRDVDGDGPEESEIVCQSAAGTAFEYCDVSGADLVAGEWWVIVMNWEESASAPDDISLALAIVPGADAGNVTVTAPDSVAATTPFDVRVFWDTPTMMAGDHWYGALDFGSDPDHPGNIGTVPVNLVRLPDDVTKEAGEDMWPTLAFTITVMPSVTGEDITYLLTDTIPTGMTYVAESATATEGVVDVVGNQLTWTGTMLSSREFKMSTSATDPDCSFLFGTTYFDAETELGWGIDEGVGGNGIQWSYGGFPVFDFFGESKKTSPTFTDDGYATFGTAFSSVNQDIPDATVPNDLLAPLWFDFEIVTDTVLNKGVTAGSIPDTLWFVEFDDVEPAPAGSTGMNLDFEVMMATLDDSPGAYEVAFAYDNISSTFISGTIGVENSDGTDAVKLAYNDVNTVIADGLAVCLDWAPLDPAQITYEVTVDPTQDVITNTVWHVTDEPGSKPAYVEMPVTVIGPEPHWNKVLWIGDDGPYGPEEGSFEGLVPTDTITIVDMVEVEYQGNVTFTLTEEWNELLEMTDYTLNVLPGGTLFLPGSALPPGLEVATGTGMMTLEVTDMPWEWSYVLTKTYEVAVGTLKLGDVGYITETLWVENASPQLGDIVLEFRPWTQFSYLPVVMRDY
jgi:subtilisin family serine protease